MVHSKRVTNEFTKKNVKSFECKQTRERERERWKGRKKSRGCVLSEHYGSSGCPLAMAERQRSLKGSHSTK